MSVKYTLDLTSRYVGDRLKNTSQQFLPGVGGASVLLLGRDCNMNVTSMITSYKAVTCTLSPDFFIDCLAYFNELPQHLESPHGKGL